MHVDGHDSHELVMPQCSPQLQHWQSLAGISRVDASLLVDDNAKTSSAENRVALGLPRYWMKWLTESLCHWSTSILEYVDAATSRWQRDWCTSTSTSLPLPLLSVCANPTHFTVQSAEEKLS